MKAKFNFTTIPGKFFPRDKLDNLLRENSFHEYLEHMKGTPLTMTLEPEVKKASKQALYDYYHGIVLKVAIDAYTEAGYELMDEVKVDYLLKAECAKGTIIGPEGEEVYLLDKSKMDKKRLIKFVSDCIIHLEMNLNVKVPDAEEYKNWQKTGHRFKSTKYFK